MRSRERRPERIEPGGPEYFVQSSTRPGPVALGHRPRESKLLHPPDLRCLQGYVVGRPDRQHPHGVLVVVAKQRREFCAEEGSHLSCDPAEEVAGRTASATNVATRLRAACSSARRRVSARDSVLEIAVATRSVKAAILASVSTARGSGLFEEATITPQGRPSTVIGAPTDDRTPRASIYLGDFAGASPISVETGRATALVDQACDGGVVEMDVGADGGIGSVRAPAAHTGHHAVRFVARQVRAVDVEELPQLSRDRHEHHRR